MTAEILKPTYGINSNHRKEDKFTDSYTIVAFENGKFSTPVELRIYSTQARNYACLWVHSGDIHASGSGWAGGYGYHRPSAAANEAIKAAGFKLSGPISGYGETIMQDALKAIAEALGHKTFYLLHSHG